jgi:hypothetical protein
MLDLAELWIYIKGDLEEMKSRESAEFKRCNKIT